MAVNVPHRRLTKGREQPSLGRRATVNDKTVGWIGRWSFPVSRPVIPKERMAGTTGLEPATSAVTGQRSNQLNYVPRLNRNHRNWRVVAGVNQQSSVQ